MQRQRAKEEFGRGSTRRGIIDKELAMNRAFNPSESKYGGVLLKGNTQESRLLNSELSKLDNQIRRQRMHIEQEKKQFLARRSLPEPILIVERPPSPEVIKRQLYTSDPDYFEYSGDPGYMRPTQARSKTPSTIPSIDAYSVKTKKKKNLWEDACSTDQKPRFQSTARPSWPLTEAEQRELARGWEVHTRPNKSSELLALAAAAAAANSSTRHPPHHCKNHNKKKKKKSSPPGMTYEDSSDPTFITELPKVRYSTEGLGMDRPSKNVSFADEVGLFFQAKNEAENKRRLKKDSAKKQTSKSKKDTPSEASESPKRRQVLNETTNKPRDASSSDLGSKKPISPFRKTDRSSPASGSGSDSAKKRTSKSSLDPVSEDEL